MEAVILIEIQASGKSTFYNENFSKSHIRINLDMLKTRKKENILLEDCIKSKLSFVVDNTNTTITVREKNIELSKQAGYKVLGYFFDSNRKDCVNRNEKRTGAEYVPSKVIMSTYYKCDDVNGRVITFFHGHFDNLTQILRAFTTFFEE